MSHGFEERYEVVDLFLGFWIANHCKNQLLVSSPSTGAEEEELGHTERWNVFVALSRVRASQKLEVTMQVPHLAKIGTSDADPRSCSPSPGNAQTRP